VRHVVGVADMKVSKCAGDEIITYALGSCLGITVYDPISCVGGMLHVMLPLSTIAPDKASANPFMFVDTGVPKLFFDSYKAGAVKERLIVKVAGGACASGSQEDYFQIGKRNYQMLEKLLVKNGVSLAAVDVAGSKSRTLSLEVGTGVVKVSTYGVVSLL
jgi:chemotaxis protein CheD